MDPFQHLLLPLMFLLAIRMDHRRAIMFAPLAVLPDFDALFDLHRALGHSFVPILIVPMAILLYSRYRRPEWLLSALIVQFYLASHVVLDLGGVAFLWPMIPEQFYFEPSITFSTDGGINMGFYLDYGMRELPEMTTTSFLSDTGFALILLGVLMAAVFRREAVGALREAWSAVRETFFSILRRA
ncbi:TPA: metal-dependent hydrolase [Thermoplasmata archaeon]|nr:metal-dependent hydrolase [Thermoplasmata archaeon]